MRRKDEIWKKDSLVNTFLTGVRRGIPFAAEQVDVLLRLIHANRKSVERFADLGCGDGVLAASILAGYPGSIGTLIDFSEPMIREAQSRLKSYASNLLFVVADFSTSDWLYSISNTAPFDVIVSGYAIHHQTDKRKLKLYEELFDLLEPGSLFLNIEHVASQTSWIGLVSDDMFVDSLYLYHIKNGTNKSREEIEMECECRADKEANILTPVEVQCKWLCNCGFEDVDCYFKVFEFAVFGGRRPE